MVLPIITSGKQKYSSLSTIKSPKRKHSLSSNYLPILPTNKVVKQVSFKESNTIESGGLFRLSQLIGDGDGEVNDSASLSDCTTKSYDCTSILSKRSKKAG